MPETEVKANALLTEVTLGDQTLKNRVAMAPMTRSRATNPETAVTDSTVTYYSQRASAGLLITEGSQVSKLGVGYINTPGIYSPEQTAAWKKVTDGVHAKDGKIYIQLWHVGRISHPDLIDGQLPLAPSAINPHQQAYTPEGMKDTVVPKEMTKEDIKTVVEEFKQGAKNAKEAGFDGVEIHSSNGYLLHQFFVNNANTRTDEYGGSHENKARILFEIIDAIKEVFPENRIGLRLNPSSHGLFGMEVDEETIPTFDYIVKKLNDYNLAYLHLSEPFSDVSAVPHAVANIAEHFRPLYKGTLMINAGFNQAKGNKVIEDGHADIVAIGKDYISNPDLVERYAQGAELAPYDQNTFYVPGDKGYIDYPALSDS